MAKLNYFSAAYPEPWQVLGIRLHPFSLGHYFKLKHFGCAFVADKDATATMGDLLLGIAVCSMSSDPDPTRDEFWNWWNRLPGGIETRILKWIGKEPFTPAEKEIIRWGKRIKAFDFQEKAKLFVKYIDTHCEQPSFWELKSSETKSGAHWAQSLVTGLVKDCGYNMREAYNVPVSKCLADFFKAAEDSGSIRLMSETEQNFLETQHGA